MAIISIAIFILASLLLSLPALAADPSDPYGLHETAEEAGYAKAKTKNPDDPTKIAAGIVKTVLGLIGIIFLILIIYSGIQWMTAGGNTEVIGKAKGRIMNATIGLVIVLGAYVITEFIIFELVAK